MCTRVVLNPGLSSSEPRPFVSASLSTAVSVTSVHCSHVFGTRDVCTNARVGSSVGTNEKYQPASLHVHPRSVHRSGSTLVAERRRVKRRPCLAACMSEWTTLRNFCIDLPG